MTIHCAFELRLNANLIDECNLARYGWTWYHQFCQTDNTLCYIIGKVLQFLFTLTVLIIQSTVRVCGNWTFKFFNPIKTRLFYRSKVRGGGGSLRTPLMISGTIEAGPMKICIVIVLLKAYQNTRKNFQKYGLWCYNDVITKTMGNLDPHETRQIIYHSKGNDESFPKM